MVGSTKRKRNPAKKSPPPPPPTGHGHGRRRPPPPVPPQPVRAAPPPRRRCRHRRRYLHRGLPARAAPGPSVRRTASPRRDTPTPRAVVGCPLLPAAAPPAPSAARCRPVLCHDRQHRPPQIIRHHRNEAPQRSPVHATPPQELTWLYSIARHELVGARLGQANRLRWLAARGVAWRGVPTTTKVEERCFWRFGRLEKKFRPPRARERAIE